MARTIQSINNRLEGTGVQVEVRGDRCSLRAVLPPRDGEGASKQTRLALGLGISQAELELVEAKALQLASEKLYKSFDWANWNGEREFKATATVKEWIEKFAQHQKTPRLTWKRKYQTAFKSLPADKPLTPKLLLKAVQRSPEESRSRRADYIALKELAEFAEIDVDLKPYKGSYSQTHTKPRVLPSDKAIAEIYEFIGKGRNRSSCEKWQAVYGIMACYGLRPHEVFFCSIESQPPYRLTVTEGKTGPRTVMPIYPEWAENWQLWKRELPRPCAENVHPDDMHSYLGQKCTLALCRYLKRLPPERRHQPYDLRHAYALRGQVIFGLAPRVVAAFCGHSLDIHIKIYSRYLRKDAAQQEWHLKVGQAGVVAPTGEESADSADH